MKLYVIQTYTKTRRTDVVNMQISIAVPLCAVFHTYGQAVNELLCML